MAVFSQQFSKINPREFHGGGLFEVLANSMAMDANMFISVELTREDLIGICQCIESELAMQLPDEAARRSNCRTEVDVLECAVDDGVGLCPDLKCNPTPHEQLAAYALWKLADLCTITEITEPSQLVDATVAIASASTALQIAAASFSGNLREMRLVTVSSLQVTEAAHKRARARWKERNEHRAFGLEFAKAISNPNRSEVGRQVIRAIFEQFGKKLKAETVDGWLKDSGRSRSK